MASLVETRRSISAAVEAVQESVPLSGSTTNFVTVDFVANAQLAAGGSAAMVYLPDEGEALAKMSASFYLNMGTLLASHEETMCRTVTTLSELKKPWVLDPVGIGMGEVRARVLTHMKSHAPAVIRCNPSEAIALAACWELDTQCTSNGVKGVDSTDTVDAARNAAVALARYTGGAVAVSGATDLITDGHLIAHSGGGSSLMTRVTGFGCALGGVIAVYAACASPFIAALAGSNAFNHAATRAAAHADAPASFKTAFLDELYRATPADVAANPFTLEEA